jgi:hypothetical protein
MMWSWPFRRRRSTKNLDHRSRQLHCEQFEDRRMLTTMADVVFLVDESESEGPTHTWLADLISGDDANSIPSLAERLADQGITDVRYGLVGFAEDDQRFANSFVVGTQGSSPLNRIWSDGLTQGGHTTQMAAAISQLNPSSVGILEDGWDAIDHAFAEYDFRPGAVPVLVLIQGEGPRLGDLFNANTNNSLTREGVLGGLRSKNIILNSIVAKRDDPFTELDLFDLSFYDTGDFDDITILGTEKGSAASQLLLRSLPGSCGESACSPVVRCATTG